MSTPTSDELALLAALHRDGPRQGPGGEAETRLAIALSGLAERQGLEIADIGCGTGAATLVLAHALDARITAIDLIPDFLSRLAADAARAGLAERIFPRAAAMEALPFAAESLDAIWAEASIYTMGFAAGLAAWRPLLKPGGILAVSDLTWLTGERPAEITQSWESAYPDVATAAAKLAILEQQGYAPIGYFVLPEHCWRENYYRPLEQRFDRFLAAQNARADAQAIIAAERQEIALYDRYKAYFGYGYYIARKTDESRTP